MQNKQFVFKTLLVGDQGKQLYSVYPKGVGKSSLLIQYTRNEFKNEYASTVGLEFGSKAIVINKMDSVLQIWDTAGQETFKSIIRSFYRNAAAVFVIYSINRMETFESVDNWVQEAREDSHDNVIIILVGTKLDLEAQRQVSVEQGQQKMKNLKADLFMEISNKNNSEINNLFDEVILIIQARLQNENFQKSVIMNEVSTSRQSIQQNPVKEKEKKSGCC